MKQLKYFILKYYLLIYYNPIFNYIFRVLFIFIVFSYFTDEVLAMPLSPEDIANDIAEIKKDVDYYQVQVEHYRKELNHKDWTPDEKSERETALRESQDALKYHISRLKGVQSTFATASTESTQSADKRKPSENLNADYKRR